jgi:hypothetical protein
MNSRRYFFRQLASGLAVAVAPDLFLPKLIKPVWKRPTDTRWPWEEEFQKRWVRQFFFGEPLQTSEYKSLKVIATWKGLPFQ